MREKDLQMILSRHSKARLTDLRSLVITTSKTEEQDKGKVKFCQQLTECVQPLLLAKGYASNLDRSVHGKGNIKLQEDMTKCN